MSAVGELARFPSTRWAVPPPAALPTRSSDAARADSDQQRRVFVRTPPDVAMSLRRRDICARGGRKMRYGSTGRRLRAKFNSAGLTNEGRVVARIAVDV